MFRSHSPEGKYEVRFDRPIPKNRGRKPSIDIDLSALSKINASVFIPLAPKQNEKSLKLALYNYIRRNSDHQRYIVRSFVEGNQKGFGIWRVEDGKGIKPIKTRK
jgi:hypothetical protein